MKKFNRLKRADQQMVERFILTKVNARLSSESQPIQEETQTPTPSPIDFNLIDAPEPVRSMDVPSPTIEDDFTDLPVPCASSTPKQASAPMMTNKNLDPTPITFEEVESTKLETDEVTEGEQSDMEMKGSVTSDEPSLLMSGIPRGNSCDSEKILLWREISTQAASVGRSRLQNSYPSVFANELESEPISFDEHQYNIVESREAAKKETDFSGSEISEVKLLQVSGLPCGPDGDSERFLLWKEISFQAASIGRSRLGNSVNT